MLVIVTAILLLRSGEFLQSREDYKDAREYRDLSDTIQEAVDGICASVAYHLWGGTVDPVSPSHIIGVESNKTARALLLLWPLYCASKSPGIKSTRQRWLKNALWYIGEGSKIPKAMALVRLPLVLQSFGTRTDHLNRQWTRRRAALFRTF